MFSSKKTLSIILGIMLLVLCLNTNILAYEADPYTILNTDTMGTILSFRDSNPSIIFGNYINLGDGLFSYQSDYNQVANNVLVQYSVLASNQGIIMPYFEISLNPDRYDSASEVAFYAQNFFPKISPLATTPLIREFLKLVNLATSAAEYKLMGYDSTSYIISEVNGIIIGVSFVYSAGDAYTFVCYMNLPEASLQMDNMYTIDTLNEKMNYERSREINKWFMSGTQVTEAFTITESKWEISWEILTIVENLSEYTLTVLDANDNVIETFGVGLNSILGSKIIEGTGEFKVKAEAKYGNWYIQIKRIPE